MNQIENLIQKFGYTEMYEWSNVSNKKLGLFVQFDKRNPNKIQPYTGDGVLVGVSTVCSVIESDNPDNWRFAYMANEVGDLYLKKETLAVGIKEYDQNGQPIYPEVYSKFWDNIKAGKNFYDNLNDITSDATIQAKYPDLVDLCKLWQYTSNGIFYLDDNFSLASH